MATAEPAPKDARMLTWGLRVGRWNHHQNTQPAGVEKNTSCVELISFSERWNGATDLGCGGTGTMLIIRGTGKHSRITGDCKY